MSREYKTELLFADVPAGAEGSEITLTHVFREPLLLLSVFANGHNLVRVIQGTAMLYHRNAWGSAQVMRPGTALQVIVAIERPEAHSIRVDVSTQAIKDSQTRHTCPQCQVSYILDQGVAVSIHTGVHTELCSIACLFKHFQRFRELGPASRPLEVPDVEAQACDDFAPFEKSPMHCKRCGAGRSYHKGHEDGG